MYIRRDETINLIGFKTSGSHDYAKAILDSKPQHNNNGKWDYLSFNRFLTH